METKVYGLTGQTGAGKTTVSAVLRGKGFDVIDCDEVSRAVVQPGRPALEALAARFGKQILSEDGSLDRKLLGSVVFGDHAALAVLNAIIYPFIMEEIECRIKTICSGHTNGIVLDAPTLFEAGADARCDAVISVIAPLELRRARIIARDGLDGPAADARIASQHGDEFYCGRSRYVLQNSGDREELTRQAERLADELLVAKKGA